MKKIFLAALIAVNLIMPLRFGLVQFHLILEDHLSAPQAAAEARHNSEIGAFDGHGDAFVEKREQHGFVFLRRMFFVKTLRDAAPAPDMAFLILLLAALFFLIIRRTTLVSAPVPLRSLRSPPYAV